MRITGDLYAWEDEKKPAVAQFEVVAEMDQPDLSYEFNTFRVVRHKPSGRLFWGDSAGCSCPTPFEEYFFEVDGEQVVATDMNEITDATWDQFCKESAGFCEYESDYIKPVPVDERREFMAKVRAARSEV